MLMHKFLTKIKTNKTQKEIIMLLSERIKRIRMFRSLTLRELGLELGYEERNADVRIHSMNPAIVFPKITL